MSTLQNPIVAIDQSEIVTQPESFGRPACCDAWRPLDHAWSRVRLRARCRGHLLGNLVGHGTGGAASLRERTRKLPQSVQATMDDAAAKANHLGGVKGPLTLLRDAEVQRGLQALAVLPAYFEADKRVPPALRGDPR